MKKIVIVLLFVIALMMLGCEEQSIDDEEAANKTTKQQTTESVREQTELSENNVEKNLTIQNNEDLKRLLELKEPTDPLVAEFADKYEGRIIEFDGNIATMMNHEEYDTRWDLLIYSGDYSETEVSGPSFKFEDVGVYDLGIDDLYLPNYIKNGANVHIIAEVEEYDEITGIFELDPVSITER